MEYTKGKWTANAFGVRANDMEIADCVLGNVRQPGMTITEAQANAERIVKAVLVLVTLPSSALFLDVNPMPQNLLTASLIA